MTERVAHWRAVQGPIASCEECCARWPSAVTSPLNSNQMPDPPDEIDILFVGVAPALRTLRVLDWVANVPWRSVG